MEMIPVASSNVLAIGYDQKNKLLRVEFHNGHLYEYSAVPVAVFDAFLESNSKGSFVWQVLRAQGFPYVQLA
jgi:KTSC domain